MIRSILSIAAGYFAIAIPNSFIHVIISVYFKAENVALTGITNLPSATWVVGITALQLALGIFGGLLASTIAQQNKHHVILGFILLMVIIGFTDYSMLNNREPIWYLIAAPTLKIAGIFTGYKLQIQQAEQPQV